MVSGCSFTHNKTWPEQLASTKAAIKNLGKGGAGNSYISNSITAAVDWKPDFVFILWSGINRIELRTPDDSIFEKYVRNTGSSTINNSRYWMSGGAIDVEKGWIAAYNQLRDPSWPTITNLSQWFDLPEIIKQECLESKINLSVQGDPCNISAFINHYYITQYLQNSRKYYSELTFQNMMNCFNMLEKLNIPYRFSFIYDIFSENHQYSLGKAIKEHYYKYIDWSRYINFTPYEYGVKYDLISDDGFHLTDQGYNQWGTDLSKILQKQPDLTNLLL